MYLTKEVKPKEKYKILLAIKLRPTIKVTRDEGEEESLEFSLDTGKKVVVFSTETFDLASEWALDVARALDGEFDPTHVKPTFKEVNGDQIWDVRAGLTAEQNNVLDQFQSVVTGLNLSDKLRAWSDDICLCRFLRARQWDIKKATEMFQQAATWREQTKPDEIKLADIIHSGSSGDLYISKGKDRKGRVIVYMRPGLHDTPEMRSDYVRNMAWVMESGCKLLDTPHTGQEKLIWIVDFQGCKISGGIEENVRMSQDTINVMQNMYPERLGIGFILNPPLPFWMLWQLVSVFLDPVTKRKIQFIRNKKDQTMLLDYIEKSQLEQMYGGDIPPFNAEEWKQEYFPGQ